MSVQDPDLGSAPAAGSAEAEASGDDAGEGRDRARTMSASEIFEAVASIHSSAAPCDSEAESEMSDDHISSPDVTDGESSTPALQSKLLALRKGSAAAVKEGRAKVLRKVRARLEKTKARMKKPRFVKLKDKVGFTLGVMNFGLMCYITGAFPGIIPEVYTIKCAILIGIRLYLYRKEKWGYYLLDFCYFVNFLMLLYLWAMPDNARLFQIVFAMANGPLGVAIIMWRNSLVFHSLDKTTSLFIHIEPPVVSYIIRHHLSLVGLGHGTPRFQTGWEAWPEGSGEVSRVMIWQAIAVYAAWQIAYYLKVQVFDLEKIRRRNRSSSEKKYVTAFTYLRTQKGAIGSAIRIWPAGFQHHGFAAIQLLYTLLTLCLPPLLFYYSVAQFAWLFFLLTWSAWNGACFYVDVFTARYQEQLRQLEASSQAIDIATSINDE